MAWIFDRDDFLKALAFNYWIHYTPYVVRIWDYDYPNPYIRDPLDIPILRDRLIQHLSMLDNYIILKTKSGIHIVDFTPTPKDERTRDLLEISRLLPSDHNGKALRIKPNGDMNLFCEVCNTDKPLWSELIEIYERIVFKCKLLQDCKGERVKMGSPRVALYAPKSGLDHD